MHGLGIIPGAVWIVLGTGLVVFFFYKFLYKALGLGATIAGVLVLGGLGFGLVRIHQAVVRWQSSLIHPTQHAERTPVNGANSVDFLHPQFQMQSVFPNLNSMNPLAHQSPWLIAAVILIAIMTAVTFLTYRMMSPRARTNLLHRCRTASASTVQKRDREDGDYALADIEIGVRKDNGRSIVLEGRDRFLHTLVVGSTGTGKTSRILTKGVYQDIRRMADGNPMDVIVLDPDGGFAQSALDFATKLGVKRDVIDLRGGSGHVSTVSFNPFSGGDIADIVDNVRVVLKEQMGEQDSFFQNAQDDLVRTVIQVQVPLWPETDFVQFAELVTDPVHFRTVCTMVYDHALGRTAEHGKGKKDDGGSLSDLWAHERPYIEARYDDMEEHHRSLVLSAARSFLMDTRTEAKLEHLEKITKGLKIVVNELATNERMRQVLRRGELPMFDFQSFFRAGKEEPGRLIVVITGNRTFGKLFGKLFLITMKTYALSRDGSEWTRRPVYLYADEFSVFGTDSFIEAFSQIRKYRVAMMLAIQARSQLQDVSKKFLEVVEGNCRNKIVFPAPSSNDAKFFEDALGTVVNVKETKMENKLNWFWFDNRNIDRRVSAREEVDPRFRIEDLSYGLTKDEAVFLLTLDNQAQVPFIGYTSVADTWAKQKRGFLSSPSDAGRPGTTHLFLRLRRSEVKLTPLGLVQGGLEEAASDLSTTNVALHTLDATALGETSFVKPTANPNEVIHVQALATTDPYESVEEDMGRQQELDVDPLEMANLMENVASIHHTKNESGQEQATSSVHRFDLRRRETPPDVPSECRQGKQCPDCQEAYLELTPDERKWRCPKCGFNRKNRM
ncbi:hypothetical protein AN477_01760 [Alicyclobacillus ferrooxydans]|uniref:TraD/TraG TraM recognition site domain-containing protein n=2 Tax=Alicyclobacillus ferrooxydans TaxID=471514 RepID=A0A0P9EQA2_9BACL|nr:hypothetical protein AN477_01760 [Alicyclobacillus ferrooxydans]